MYLGDEEGRARWEYMPPAAITQLMFKIRMIYFAAHHRGSSAIYTGLLGGGAFRNNRPLILALHLLCESKFREKHGRTIPVRFHCPVFDGYTDSVARLSLVERMELVKRKADELMAVFAVLRDTRDAESDANIQLCMDFKQVLEILCACKFPTSFNDNDLTCEYDRIYLHRAG